MPKNESTFNIMGDSEFSVHSMLKPGNDG